MIKINPTLRPDEAGHLVSYNRAEGTFYDPSALCEKEHLWVWPIDGEVLYPAKQEPLRCIVREYPTTEQIRKCYGVYFFDLQDEVLLVDDTGYDWDSDETIIETYWEFIEGTVPVDLGDDDIQQLLDYVAHVYIRNLAVYKRRPRNDQ